MVPIARPSPLGFQPENIGPLSGLRHSWDSKYPVGPSDRDLKWIVGDILPITAAVASQCKRLTDGVGGSFLLLRAEDVHTLFSDINTWIALVAVADARGAIAVRAIKGHNFISAVKALQDDVEAAGKAGVPAVAIEGWLRAAAAQLAPGVNQADFKLPAADRRLQDWANRHVVEQMMQFARLPPSRGGYGIPAGHLSENGWFGAEPDAGPSGSPHPTVERTDSGRPSSSGRPLSAPTARRPEPAAGPQPRPPRAVLSPPYRPFPTPLVQGEEGFVEVVDDYVLSTFSAGSGNHWPGNQVSPEAPVATSASGRPSPAPSSSGMGSLGEDLRPEAHRLMRLGFGKDLAKASVRAGYAYDLLTSTVSPVAYDEFALGVGEVLTRSGL